MHKALSFLLIRASPIQGALWIWGERFSPWWCQGWCCGSAVHPGISSVAGDIPMPDPAPMQEFGPSHSPPTCSPPAALAWGLISASDSHWLLSPLFYAIHLPKYPEHRAAWRTWRQTLSVAGTGSSFSPDSLTLQLIHGLMAFTTYCLFPVKITPNYGKCLTLGKSRTASSSILHIIFLLSF